MEHPCKRRRVERRFNGSIGDHSAYHERLRAQRTQSVDISPVKAAQIVVSPQINSSLDTSRTIDEPPLQPRDPQIAPLKLQLRQAFPSPAASIDNNGTTVAPPPDTTKSQVSTPESVPVGDVPGLVSPLPAIAAEDARNQALQSQQAVAQAKYAVPATLSPESSAQPASSPPIVATQTAVSSQNALSIEVSSSAAQESLSNPSTPVPTTPESVPTSASYFPSSEQTSKVPGPSQTSILSQASSPAQASSSSQAPTLSLAPTLSHASTQAPKITPPSSKNSTMSATSTHSLTTTSHLVSVSSISTIPASFSSMSSLSAMTASESSMSTFLATMSQSSHSTTSASSMLPSSHTTLMTMTSQSSSQFSSQFSSQSSSAASSSSASQSSTVAGVGGGGAGNTGTAASPTSTAGSGSGSTGSGTPPTKDLVGGIVGGIAGLVMIVAVLLFLFRWRQRKQVGQQRIISPPMPQGAGLSDTPRGGTMTQRSSSVPIAAAGFFNRLRPSSSQTAGTASTGPSERGFQKISGRKLTSVLQSGGDGYGDAPSAGPSGGLGSAQAVPSGGGAVAGIAPALRPSPPHSLSGSSFYRDSRGFYGGVVPDPPSSPTEPSTSLSSTSPIFPSPPTFTSPSRGQGPASASRRPEVANIRPGPARQPVINEPGVVPVRTAPARPPRGPPSRPLMSTPTPISEHPPDGVGRSRPSQDASRGSRFKEATTPP